MQQQLGRLDQTFDRLTPAEFMVQKLPPRTKDLLSDGRSDDQVVRDVKRELIVEEQPKATPARAPVAVDGFENRGNFRQRLLDAGLLDGASGQSDQHVFHIIAASNGGPDHRDNYLYALGGGGPRRGGGRRGVGRGA